MQKRILLVDDESALRRTLSLSLNQNGYDVEPCENGLSALSKLDLYKKNHENLDVVVVDVNLPDINGKILGRIIKSKYPETAMFYITGYAERMDEIEIDELKADGLIEKPFTASDLSKYIEEVMDKRPRRKKTKPAVHTTQSVSAYALIRVTEEADFFSIYRKLYFMENVLYCDATRGDYDIFLLLQADTPEACREIFDSQILPLHEIKEASFLPVSVPVLKDTIKNIINAAGISMFEDMPGMEKFRDNKKSVCSYVMIEAEREKLEDLYPVLRLTENVLYCDYIAGKNNLLIMIYGSQFSEIDKIIKNKIVKLGGVLKIKEYPIINIFEM